MSSADSAMKTAGVILAARKASRFGSDKRLAKFDDSHTLLTRTTDLFLQCCDDVFVVLKPSDKENEQLLFAKLEEKVNLHFVYSDGSAQGMGSSLSDAITFLDVFEAKYNQKFTGVLLGLADMPFIRLTTMKKILASKSAKRIIVPSVFNEEGVKKLGHPVWFGRLWFDQLKLLRGDRGGRSIISENPQAVTELPVKDAGILRDIDEPSDLK